MPLCAAAAQASRALFFLAFLAALALPSLKPALTVRALEATRPRPCNRALWRSALKGGSRVEELSLRKAGPLEPAMRTRGPPPGEPGAGPGSRPAHLPA